MITSHRAIWLIPSGLIALSVIPILAGAFRIAQLVAGSGITPDNARFAAAPRTVILHLLTAPTFCLLGAFQFAPDFRRRHPAWHRVVGRILVPIGLVSALTGLWLTQSRPSASFVGEEPANFDGPFVYAFRLMAGLGMVSSLCLGLAAVLKRDFRQHQDWMMRGYALGLGAGTQVFTHLPWFLFPSIRGEWTRAVFMGSGWLINATIAEWLIRRKRSLPLPKVTLERTVFP